MDERIHDAASEGNLAEVNRLLAEDVGRLNAQDDLQRTPLMYAAYRGHDAVVARLIELGADVGLQDENGDIAAHLACMEQDNESSLALLLDAGASINSRNSAGETPLILAAFNDATKCVKLLLARGGAALELNAQNSDSWAALHYPSNAQIIQLLLQAGADPTIPDNDGHTPLDVAQQYSHHSSIALLQAALAEPQRPRLLLKARALLDAAVTTSTTFNDARDDGLSMAATQRAVLAVTPAYLKERVRDGDELPSVSIVDADDESEEVVACLKYALGLAYGGGVHFEGEEQPVGMLREVLVELCELLVPKWDRKNV